MTIVRLFLLLPHWVLTTQKSSSFPYPFPTVLHDLNNPWGISWFFYTQNSWLYNYMDDELFQTDMLTQIIATARNKEYIPAGL